MIQVYIFDTVGARHVLIYRCSVSFSPSAVLSGGSGLVPHFLFYLSEFCSARIQTTQAFTATRQLQNAYNTLLTNKRNLI